MQNINSFFTWASFKLLVSVKKNYFKNGNKSIQAIKVSKELLRHGFNVYWERKEIALMAMQSQSIKSQSCDLWE